MGTRKKRESVLNKAPNRQNLEYTPKQRAILNGDLSLDEIRTTELAAIVKKALARSDELNFEIANSMRLAKKDPGNYSPKITVEEALSVLQSLTPWELDY